MKLLIIIYFFVIMLMQIILSSSSIIITNGPQDTVVCMNVIAECDCGFTGASPHTTVPSWRIVSRNDDGSVVSNVTHDDRDIVLGHINGLQWSPDVTNAANSKLLVGPVNKTYNHSSYQCSFTILSGSVSSSVGTMTVVDAPLVIINVDEICTTSITISLNTYSHPACGDVSHNVTISGNAADTINGSKYTFKNLKSGTLYNVRVISLYNNQGTRTQTQSMNTSSSRSPNPINTDSIEIMITNSSGVTVIWKPPEIDECSMVAVKHYNVRISSTNGEIMLEGTVSDNAATFAFNYVDEAIFVFDYVDDHSTVTFTISITVVDINGQRNESSVVQRNITGLRIQNKVSATEESDTGSSGEVNESSVSIIIIIIIVVIVVVVIVSVIPIIIVSYLKYHRCHSHDMNLEKMAKENSYVETQDESHDLASPNTHQDETIHEQLTSDDHVDESADNDDSTPPLPPRMNYVELQLANEGPKRMITDTHVTYVETKPA